MKNKLFKYSWQMQIDPIDIEEFNFANEIDENRPIFRYPDIKFQKWLKNRYYLDDLVDDLDLKFIKSLPFSVDLSKPLYDIEFSSFKGKVDVKTWVKLHIPVPYQNFCLQKLIEYRLLLNIAAVQLERQIDLNEKLLDKTTKQKLILKFHNSCFNFLEGTPTFNVGKLYKYIIKIGFDEMSKALAQIEEEVALQIASYNLNLKKKEIFNLKMDDHDGFIDLKKKEVEFLKIEKEKYSYKVKYNKNKNNELTAPVMALFLYYLMEGNIEDKYRSIKDIQALCIKYNYNKSPKNVRNLLISIGTENPNDPMTSRNVKKVIDLLKPYPSAKGLAENDFYSM